MVCDLDFIHFYSRWRSWCGKNRWMLLISVFIGIPVALYWVTFLLGSYRYMREVLHVKEKLLLLSFLYCRPDWCRIYWIWSFKSNRSLWFRALMIGYMCSPQRLCCEIACFTFEERTCSISFFPMDWPANKVHSSTWNQGILMTPRHCCTLAS